jgi:conjugal transfer pilus assembly protein TraU
LRYLTRLWIAVVLAFTLSGNTQAQQICNGSFPNLITDVCYDCIFPISIMGGFVNLGVSGPDYDTGKGLTPVS